MNKSKINMKSSCVYKLINLFQGNVPLFGKNSILNNYIKDENSSNSYCAIFTDLLEFQEINIKKMNDELIDKMLLKYGSKSEFGKTNSYMRPFLVDLENKLVMPDIFLNKPINSEILEESDYRVGGLFFNEDISSKIISELENNEYHLFKEDHILN